MNSEFRANILALTRAFGAPLTSEQDKNLHDYYLEDADLAGTPLPSETTLGRVAYGATYLGKTLVLAEVSILNESFGNMTNTEYGHLCGEISLEARGVTSDTPTPSLSTPWSLSASMYTSGAVELAIAEFDPGNTEAEALFENLQIKHIAETEAKSRWYIPKQGEHILNTHQLSQLGALVADCFIER